MPIFVKCNVEKKLFWNRNAAAMAAAYRKRNSRAFLLKYLFQSASFEASLFVFLPITIYPLLFIHYYLPFYFFPASISFFLLNSFYLWMRSTLMAQSGQKVSQMPQPVHSLLLCPGSTTGVPYKPKSSLQPRVWVGHLSIQRPQPLQKSGKRMNMPLPSSVRIAFNSIIVHLFGLLMRQAAA